MFDTGYLAQTLARALLMGYDGVNNKRGGNEMKQPRVIILTGGAQGIGRAAAEAFHAAGELVAVMDILEADTACDWYFQGDLSQQADLEDFAQGCIQRYGGIDGLIHNAMSSRGGYPDCGYQDFMWAQAVGVGAPYYLTSLLAPHFPPGASVVMLSSTRAFQSQAGTESYSAAKGGITALTHALSVSLRGRARVNAIAPGWIDTSGAAFGGPDASQHPAGRVGRPEDIVAAMRYLMSDEASFITGQTLVVDGGMSRQMIYHGDEGWTLES